MSNSLRPHGLQHAGPPCPSPTTGAYSNSCLLSWWYHPTMPTMISMEPWYFLGTSLVAQLVKNPPAMQENWVWSLGWEDPLKKGMVTHSSILAWRIPGLYSSWGPRVRHDWVTFTCYLLKISMSCPQNENIWPEEFRKHDIQRCSIHISRFTRLILVTLNHSLSLFIRFKDSLGLPPWFRW